MWDLDHKEGWELKNWCFWTVELEKTLESPLDSQEIKPVHPKGNQCWIFIGRTDAEAETPVLWPPDANSQLIGKDPDAGKDWGLEEKGATEDELISGHYQLNGHEFEQTLGVGDGQGGLTCCNPWGHKVGHDWATGQHCGLVREEGIVKCVKSLECDFPKSFIESTFIVVGNSLNPDHEISIRVTLSQK